MADGHKIIFDGHDLSEIICIQSFNKGIQLGRSLNYLSRANRKGMQRTGYNSELAVFTTDFIINPDSENAKSKLAKILNVTVPKELTISTEPGKVYYAFPVGNIDSNETSPFGEGTITWEIPDGVAYSLPEYIFTNKDTAGDLQNYIVVNNPGTEPMTLDLETKFSSDNGFLGISNDTGTNFLAGDMSEVDWDYRDFSQTLFDDHFYEARNAWVLNSGIIPPVTANPRQQGYVSYIKETTTEGFAKPTYGTVVTTDWYGPSLTREVPVNIHGEKPLNWSSEFRVDFNPDGSGTAAPFQVGHNSMTFTDTNGKILVAIIFEDTNATAAKSNFAIYVDGKRVYDTRNSDYYYITARPGGMKHVRVTKYHKRIGINIYAGSDEERGKDPITGKVYQDLELEYYLPTENRRLHKVTWYAARYKSHPAINNNLLRAINVRGHLENDWYNVPNKLKNGDVLKYLHEGSHFRLEVNRINRLQLLDPGSTAITAPPGQSMIYLAVSDFANLPTVTLKGKARYVI